uniref:Core-2/I-Branching enzyme n=1 Tax=Ascaris lumbricoides TaxID=6252 RepID=A0A0M3II45_ASCLU
MVDASCKAIRRRVLQDLISPTKFEVDFPIAFVRVVYKDYLLQELLFKLQYTPMNLFCFVIDKKSSALFKEQISNLTECFPNAISSQRQLSIDSAGHNMLNGFFECFRLLLTRPKWKYLITLQNHDIPLRTNFELVNILQALNGSNDVGVLHAIPERIPKHIQWTYKALHLFKDETKNDNRSLKITKGSASCSLSRAFVDFIVNKLDVGIFIALFNQMYYGVDEMLFSTLHSNEQLEAPGGYTTQCLNKFNGYITRYVVWKRSQQCKSGIDRHRVCILGVADLADLERSRFLFANKMIPFIDYSAISCWAQRLLNRSLIQNRKRPINTYYYSHLPVVKFNNQRHSFAQNTTNFRC